MVRVVAAMVWVFALAIGLLGCGARSPGSRAQADGGVGPGASGPARGTAFTACVSAPGKLPCWPWTVTCIDGHQPQTPIDYGRCALDAARFETHHRRGVVLGVIGDAVVADVSKDALSLLDARPESFVIVPGADKTWIVGRDAVGGMYGALEVAERLRLGGADAVPPAALVRGAPAVGFRAVNPFLVLPEPGETSWWFHDEGYWTAYLDLLAHARLNFLDLHGMYDLDSTLFPNALLYFARSSSFPDVGAPAADRERNLAMLNRIVTLAAARGIKVGLMSYNALTSIDARSGDVIDAADVKTYTHEAARDLATRAPGLARLGFRIGESGRPASWYADTFVAGVAQANTDVAPYTRTWWASKADILALAAASSDKMVVEAKYNGEHWGAPYAVAGGAFTAWSALGYGYQGFLAAPAPYDFVFQIRAGGTHRIFRQASYARTRRTILSLSISPRVAGFTMEPPHAYFSQRDNYHVDAADRVSAWTFARDDLMHVMWGRLSYDPETPEDLFRSLLARQTGGDTSWDTLQAAGEIVPWFLSAMTCGPDSRNFAPELELGGDVGWWASPQGGSTDLCYRHGPFDTFAISGPDDAAADLVAGVKTGRLSPVDVAARILGFADQAGAAAGLADGSRTNVVVRDIAREARALADLGRYVGHKLKGATALAVYARTGRADWLAAARVETATAGTAWRQLATDTSYIRPFADHLRMLPLGYDPFHWAAEIPALAADPTAIDAVVARVAASPPASSGVAIPDAGAWLQSVRPDGPGLAALSVTPFDPAAPEWAVRARFATGEPAATQVRILWKSFDSQTDWNTVTATAMDDGSYVSRIAGTGGGALFAVEVESAQGAWRYPDPERETPYLSLPP